MVVGAGLVMAILLVFALLARSALASGADPALPDEGVTLRHVAEVIAEWLDGFVAQVSELHGARKMVPFFGSIFMFILTANVLGLIPGMEPPTSDTNLTFALASICFIFYLYQGFKAHGAGYLKSFLGPVLFLLPLMMPIEIARQPVPAVFARHSSLRQHVCRPSGARALHRADLPGFSARLLCLGRDRLRRAGAGVHHPFDQLCADGGGGTPLSIVTG